MSKQTETANKNLDKVTDYVEEQELKVDGVIRNRIARKIEDINLFFIY